MITRKKPFFPFVSFSGTRPAMRKVSIRCNFTLSALLLSLSLVAGCRSIQKAPVERDPSKEIAASFGKLLDSKGFKSAFVGVFVKDTGNGRVLFSFNQEKSFMPASNMKLFTAALALDVLGPSFQARTRLFTQGKVQAGVLNSDLILQGGGDPSFGKEKPEEAFRGFSESLWRKGIRRVDGDIIVDDDFFEDEPGYEKSWQWYDLSRDYGAPFGAMTFSGNVLKITAYTRPEKPNRNSCSSRLNSEPP